MSRRHRAPLIPPKRPLVVTPKAALAAAQQLLASAEELHRAGQLPAAIRGYRLLLEQLGPSHPLGLRAAFLTALVAYQQQLNDEAILLMSAVRDKHWDNAEVHYNLGIFHHAAGDPTTAAECYRAALAIKPDMATAENNLANALREMGDTDTAQLCYNRLLARDPQDPDARYNLAYITLLRGMLGRGFALYEDRLRSVGYMAEYVRGDLTTPRAVKGQAPCRLFVHQEQGIGDTIQYLRFLPRLLALGHTVTFETPIELGAWLKTLPEVAKLPGLTVITRGEPIPEHDAFLAMMSLPHFVGCEDETEIPPPLPLPAPVPSPLWTDAGDTRPVIGLCWAGNPRHRSDHHRSATLAALAPLLARENTRFVSLQVGSRGVDLFTTLPQLELGAGSELVTCSAGLTSFAATAALLRECAAVVTVDTAIAHVAGTLGVRTLVLTSWLSEWRWQLERTDSPWYPSVTVVRQPKLGDWSATAAHARTLLEDLA